MSPMCICIRMCKVCVRLCNGIGRRLAGAEADAQRRDGACECVSCELGLGYGMHRLRYAGLSRQNAA